MAWGAAALACAGAIVWVSDHETLPDVNHLASRTSRFAGVWFYSRHSEPPGKVTGPEFIETRITEEGGRMKGKYRARYNVKDQPEVPSVDFDFTGQVEGVSAEMPFTSDDGGHGEVKLRLLSESEMELDWTSAGSAPATQASGAAILVKSR